MIVPRTHATPTPFGKARAQELWARRGPAWALPDLKPGEDEYVRAIWEKLPGWTCWIDAFLAILNGERLPEGFEALP